MEHSHGWLEIIVGYSGAMRRMPVVLMVALSALVVTSCVSSPEPEPEPVLATQTPEWGPTDGSMDVSFELGEADPTLLEVKIYYPQLGERVQVMAATDEGAEEQVYFLNLSGTDLDADGSYVRGPQFDFVYQLTPGVNTVRVLLDGNLFFGPVVYELENPEPPKAESSGTSSGGSGACSDAERESARQVVVYGYMAWAGNQIGEYDKINEFVGLMNQGLGSSGSSKVSALLRDSLAWVDSGLDYGTLLSLQDRGQLIVNTNLC